MKFNIFPTCPAVKATGTYLPPIYLYLIHLFTPFVVIGDEDTKIF